MRLAFLLATVLCLFAACGFSEERRPAVVVELFTSEACSSCPPADEMLERLEQGVSGVRVIALEEHIDYWNNTGWADRFSSPLFHARQNDYAVFFQSDSIYTPQIVVNGKAQFVADHYSHVVSQIEEAAIAPQYSLWLQPRRDPRNSAIWDLSIYVKNIRQAKPEPADVYLAISETHLTSNVKQGENAGRSLHHGPVVRSFGVIGNIEARPFNQVGLRSTLKIPSDWNADNLRAVVFIQEHRSRHITAAASTSLKN
jgi:hypothetical protein